MRTLRRQHDDREGFTLLELLLVLALLVVLAGLSGPALRGPAANARLRDAARQLRAHWSEARIDAMQQGTTFAWRYAPEGSRYARMPFATPPWIDTEDHGAELRSNQAPRDEARATVVDQLPDQVSFAEPDRFAGSHDTDLDGDLDSGNIHRDDPLLDDSASLNEGFDDEAGWSDPILFYPDGTTSDSVVVLRDERGHSLRVALRGITGTATLGRVQTNPEEVAR